MPFAAKLRPESGRIWRRLKEKCRRAGCRDVKVVGWRGMALRVERDQGQWLRAGVCGRHAISFHPKMRQDGLEASQVFLVSFHRASSRGRLPGTFLAQNCSQSGFAHLLFISVPGVAFGWRFGRGGGPGRPSTRCSSNERSVWKLQGPPARASGVQSKGYIAWRARAVQLV